MVRASGTPLVFPTPAGKLEPSAVEFGRTLARVDDLPGELLLPGTWGDRGAAQSRRRSPVGVSGRAAVCASHPRELP